MQISSRFQGLSGITQQDRGKTESEEGAPQPEDTFQRSSSSDTAQKAGLLALGVIAGAGAVTGAMVATQPPQVVVQLQAQDAQKATESFSYLDQVAHQHGGNLKSDPITLLDRVIKRQPEASPQEAVTALTLGKTVYFSTPQGTLPIHDVEELKQVTQQVRADMTEEEFLKGVEHIRDGFNSLGDQIRHEINGILGQ